MPAGRGGDVFTAEPDIGRQYARHQAGIDVILFNITIIIKVSDDASNDLSDTAVNDEIILWAAVNPSAA